MSSFVFAAAPGCRMISMSAPAVIMAEAVMLKLGEAIGRQEAHDVVYESAQAAVTENRAFAEKGCEVAGQRALRPECVTLPRAF